MGIWITWHNNGNVYFAARNGDTKSATFAYYATGWHHFMGVYDGGAGTAKLYIDGSLVDTETGMTSALRADAGNGFVIGALDSPGTDYYGDGGIDEVAVFDSDKSGSASAIYNSGVPTDLSEESGLVAYYRMGEGGTFSTNWTIPDDSTNSNDGTSANMEEADRSTSVPS